MFNYVSKKWKCFIYYQVQSDKNRILAEVEKYKVKNQHLIAENERLKSVIEKSKSGLSSTTGPTTFRLCLKKINLCKNPSCRVMAFNKNTMMLVSKIMFNVSSFIYIYF